MALTDTDNYNIHIKTTSDGKGVNDSTRDLQQLGDTAGRVAKDIGIGLLALGGAAVGFGVSSVKAFSESQDILAQTNAVIKSTGGAAGITADQVQEMASALQKTTKYSDEDTKSVENLLLTFTSIGKDIFPQATKTVLDMATALGEDTKSASIQLGKALQDPVNGITALKRVGVNFTDAQKEVIKKLVDTGKSAEAQKVILQELNKEFGGSAEAAGGTFAGSLAKLKNSFNDVQESIGETLVKGLTPLAQKLSDFVASDKFQAWLKELTKWLNENIPKAIDWVAHTLLPQLKKAFDELWPIIKDVLKWFGDLVKFLIDNQWVFWAIVGVLGAIRTAMFLQGALAAFTAVIGGVTAVWGGLTALIAAPILMPALVVAAALASIALVVGAINSAIGLAKTLNDTQKAIEAGNKAIDDANVKLMNAAANGKVALDYVYRVQQSTGYQGADKIYKQNSGGQTVYTSGYADGGYTGMGGENEVAGVVHKGEYVIPKNQVDQGTGLPRTVSNKTSTTNIGTVILQSVPAVKSFFDHLDSDNILGSKGLTPVRGMN